MSRPDPSRFDLETAIAAWRHLLAQQRVFSDSDLDELERHLRDHTAHLVTSGLSEDAAYHRALQALGDLEGGEAEYRKVHWGKLRRHGRIRHELQWRLAMLENYFTVALRTMRRHAGYTLINVTGLAVGLACCLLIAAYLRHEWSYDRFHEHADRIVRVLQQVPDFGYSGSLPVTALEHFKHTYPEVVSATFLMGQSLVLRKEAQWVREELIHYADSSLFDVFTFPLLAGDASSVLRAPNSIVLTETMAEKYFGTENPIGQSLTVNDGATLTVTGVMVDVPSNSHLRFTALVSLSTVFDSRDYDPMTVWRLSGALYLRLNAHESTVALQERLNAFTEQEERVLEAFRRWHADASLHLYPLTRLHLFPNMGDADPAAPSRYLYLLATIAVFVLLLAWINYMNLATANAAERTKEVGMRKVAGARPRQLVVQFLGESLFVSMGALLLSLLLVQALLPGFNRLTGNALRVHYDLPTLGGLLGMVLLTGLIAGSYPALVLSRFRPIRMLRGGTLPGSNTRLRRGLVVFQFTVTMALLVATLVVHRQVRYMQSKSLGYRTEHVVQMVLPESAIAQSTSIKAEMGRLTGISGVSLATGLPSTGVVGLPGFPVGDRSVEIQVTTVDPDYLDVLGFDLIRGRPFDASRAADSSAVILNETAIRVLEAEELVGQSDAFDFYNGPNTIVGVVRDFHTASLHKPIGPTVLAMPGAGPLTANKLVLRLEAGRTAEALSAVASLWNRLVPGEPFAYSFADELLAEFYLAERRTGRLFAAFTGLAVFIGGLGLFGLATFSAQRRTREIGIRKVLGATMANIVGLLSREFLALVGIALVLAVPLAYVAMDRWLNDFAYRIDLGPGVFLVTGAVAVLITVVSVGYQSMRAALANPAESLRTE